MGDTEHGSWTSVDLSRHIRSCAVTYKRVVEIERLSDEHLITLECGHEMKYEFNRPNTPHIDQVRYCHECTEGKLRVTGDA